MVKEHSGRGWGMVVAVGSVHQVREYSVVPMGKSDWQVRCLPSSSSPFPMLCPTGQLMAGSLSPECRQHLFPLQCGVWGNGAACGLLRDINWAKQG